MNGFEKLKLHIKPILRPVKRDLINYWKFLHRKPKIHKTVQLDKKKLITIKNFAEIKAHVIIWTYVSPVVIGEYTQLNPFIVIYGGAGVYIGNYVMIAPHCVIASGNHNYVQTEQPMRFASGSSTKPIIIEDDVWIGANCTITDGVKIGKGAVVGANSLVTKDVNPYDIVGGVPTRVLGNRLHGGIKTQDRHI